ncbi:Protein CBG01838 [Caenorhabditis briggsae]|uniref:Protein CBG01838 n=1 Tax=Caenorhabditis briggsae TaxID=6238 RepID=A8WQP2_CAEBR|nr:Protein CBG01838 [Caenorhabditis briggsae]CAP22800.2 Protein CBG01838 [Caenorhabditis briggsae]
MMNYERREIQDFDIRISGYINFVLSEGLSENSMDRLDGMMSVINGAPPPVSLGVIKRELELLRNEWENLECPKCHRKVENSDVLTEHLVSNHGKTQDKVWFKQFGTLGSDMAKSLDKALRKQEETSLVKKKFGDSNDLITCPVASPLAPFFMMRHFQVFRDEMCPSATEGIVVGITVPIQSVELLNLMLQNDEKSFSPIFCFQKLDKARRRIKRGLLRKTMEKKVKILEKRCDKVSVDEPDIVFKKSRTADETRDLLQALQSATNGISERYR